MSNTDEAINYPRIKSVKFQANAEYIYIHSLRNLLKYENTLNIEKLTTAPKVRQSALMSANWYYSPGQSITYEQLQV